MQVGGGGIGNGGVGEEDGGEREDGIVGEEDLCEDGDV